MFASKDLDGAPTAPSTTSQRQGSDHWARSKLTSKSGVPSMDYAINAWGGSLRASRPYFKLKGPASLRNYVHLPCGRADFGRCDASRIRARF